MGDPAPVTRAIAPIEDDDADGDIGDAAATPGAAANALRSSSTSSDAARDASWCPR